MNCKVASIDAIEYALRAHYASENKDEIREVLEDEASSAPETVIDLPREEIEDEAPVTKLVHQVIAEASHRRASDIHFEPLEHRFRIRYRIDGVLHEFENPHKRLQNAIISRIKLMAKINIAERRIPQDGRIHLSLADKSIDLRVSTLPSAYGETIVMRILDKEDSVSTFPNSVSPSEDRARFEKIISLPDGVFLVTGPTGSGKSNHPVHGPESAQYARP